MRLSYPQIFAPGSKGVRVGKRQWQFCFSRLGFCPQMKNGHLLILKKECILIFHHRVVNHIILITLYLIFESNKQDVQKGLETLSFKRTSRRHARVRSEPCEGNGLMIIRVSRL